jgi:MarR family 2-MHQ and catechol resistance regulon transcriptional repressor
MTSKEVIIKLIRMNCAINEQLMLTLKPFGISVQQFNVLRILRGQKGVAANLFTVQEKMVNKMSNTTRIIDKLIDKSFVKRIICKENRRKIELFITEEGLNFLKQVDPVIDQIEEKMTDHLSEKEKQEMLILLNKLNLN